jgi:hypothetical protein
LLRASALSGRIHLPLADEEVKDDPESVKLGYSLFNLTRALSVPGSLRFPAFPCVSLVGGKYGANATLNSGLKFIRSNVWAAMLTDGGRARQGI